MKYNIDELNEQIAIELKSCRIASGNTQKAIADLTGKAPQTVASWESGKAQPSIQYFLVLCHKYGIRDVMRHFFFVLDTILVDAKLDGNVGSLFGFDGEDKLLSKEERELMTAFRMIEDKKDRAVILNMARRLQKNN